jgi:OmpA-OmpF porin, OOP family
MLKLKTIPALLALIGGFGAMSAQAQSTSYDDSWYAAPSVGIMDPVGRKLGVSKDGVDFGLRFGKPITPTIDLQIGGSVGRAKQFGATYRQTVFGVDGLFFLSRDTFRPYLALGAGIANNRLNNPQINLAGRSTNLNQSISKTSPEINAGIGFQLGLNKSLALQADARRVISFIGNSDFRGGNGRAHTNYFGLGLNFSFGGAPSEPPPVRKAEPAPAPVTPPAPPAPTPTPPPPPAPVVQQPAPPPAPEFERITLSDTELFAFDRAELKMPQPKLDEIASMLQANPQIDKVVVSGHTDRLGSDAYNRGLSQRRADAVKKYLVSKGVVSNRLNAVGKGETTPVVQCNEKDRKALISCLAPNRRVEVEQISVERRIR